MGKYKMYEPYGFEDDTNYISKKYQIDKELQENRVNDCKEFASVEYNKSKKSLVFKNVNGEERGNVDMSNIVPEDLISDVKYNSQTKKLIITFTNGKVVEIPMDDLIDVFEAGDGLELNDNKFSIKLSNDCENFLTVDENGLKLNGVENAISNKADKGDSYTKEESDERYAPASSTTSGYATEEWVQEQGYATEQWVNEQGYLTEHQSLSGYATIEEVDEKDNAVKALIPTVPTSNTAFTNDAGYLTEHQSLSGYATEEWVQAQGYLTEHQDISNLATKEELQVVESKVDAIDLTPYAKSEDVTNEITSAVTTLNEKNNEQDETIALKADASVVYTQEEVNALLLAKEKEIYSLTKIVGDMGGAVNYELPNEMGTSFNTLMNNNGTVKLTDDVTTSRFGPGITASNKVKLNLNTHDLNITGLTLSSAQAAIMARGTQEITIGGKGTIDSAQGICIEGNGASSVINLTGSTTVYQNNRSGGELVYCYAGTINITSGTFRNDGEDKKFMLNCYDANYRNGTAKIIVSGGKFYDFDPGNNAAEGEGTSFLAEGYHTESSTVVEEGVEHIVYTVKKD